MNELVCLVPRNECTSFLFLAMNELVRFSLKMNELVHFIARNECTGLFNSSL